VSASCLLQAGISQQMQAGDQQSRDRPSFKQQSRWLTSTGAFWPTPTRPDQQAQEYSIVERFVPGELCVDEIGGVPSPANTQTRFVCYIERMRLCRLAPFGLWSISRSDIKHWSREDCDWGGGGQYVGQTGRLTELLFTVQRPDLGWQVLRRIVAS
jgi:hypothetical protein